MYIGINEKKVFRDFVSNLYFAINYECLTLNYWRGATDDPQAGKFVVYI